MKCKNCIYWGSKYKDENKCDRLKDTDKLTYDIFGDGVDTFYTKSDFGCNEFKKKQNR